MAIPSPYLAGNYAPVTDETTINGPAVDGALPTGLDGQYLRLGPNPAHRPDEPYAWGATDTMVHAVELRNGRAIAYRNRWILTPHVAGVLGLGPPTSRIDSCERLVSVDRRVVAVARTGKTFEVNEDLSTRQIRRGTGSRPDRCLGDITAAGHGHHPLVAGDGRLRTNPALILERGPSNVDILDRAPQGWLTAGAADASAPRFVYALALQDDRPFAATVMYKHDLARRTRETFDFGGGRHPGELTFVPDDVRRHDEDGGWLIGFVHDDALGADDLVVLDAQHPADGPIACVHLPRRVPYGWHGLWRAR